ncbi:MULTISPECIES: P-loop NTPase fold protein [unclassified Streptomyces]|uniref:P-loop NTPase fold protein n=1 Tax=unclassified Streptomyces TaxID=2593676 RepID=UPI002DD9BF28|nr:MULTISPECIES: P-loop NTPase fold protein [unclassified Streptomyces]WSA90524.1 KAP family NTPase [Streptomyces sp. NBC_01795]WSS16868.1 KAP family NTPase [Streptomyces sp. NBC_01186]WSS45611.1 KAP family NTPase [Streptomyces sp. NBC_01187]
MLIEQLHRAGVAVGGRKSRIIEDVAISQRDEDPFDHASVARELADITRNSKEALAIGLLGRYGTGKSSVVRLLKDELSNDIDYPSMEAEQLLAEVRTRQELPGHVKLNGETPLHQWPLAWALQQFALERSSVDSAS